jgi:hypothetical protein
MQSMDGSYFPFSGLRDICHESGNPFFGVDQPFHVDLEGVRIVRYFGSGSEVVTIPNETETLGYCSFASCPISTIRFESMSRLSWIESQTFYRCEQLQSICIPSSGMILGEHCFAHCNFLHFVSFEPDSQLVSIDGAAVGRCLARRSIVLPSRLEVIGESWFFFCQKLELVIFPNDSKLVRIEKLAFGQCFSLKTLSLPSTSRIRW